MSRTRIFVCLVVLFLLFFLMKNTIYRERFKDSEEKTVGRYFDTAQQAYDAASINVQWAIPSAS